MADIQEVQGLLIKLPTGDVLIGADRIVFARGPAQGMRPWSMEIEGPTYASYLNIRRLFAQSSQDPLTVAFIADGRAHAGRVLIARFNERLVVLEGTGPVT